MNKKSDLGETRLNEISKSMSFADSEEFWRLAIEASNYIPSCPDQIWELILNNGVRSDEEIKLIVATCLLEHLLEFNFMGFFPKLRFAVLVEKIQLSETFLLCWKYGQSEEPQNSAQWDKLVDEIERTRKLSIEVDSQ